MKFKNWNWNHGTSHKRREILLKVAKSRFDHIIEDTIVNKVISVFGKLDENYQEFPLVMEYGEHVFTRHYPHNHLIIRGITEYPGIGQMPFFKERADKIKLYYPRLRYVLLIDQKAIKVKETKKDYIRQILEPDGHCIFLKEFDDPKLVIDELDKFTTFDPKKCPGITVAGQGENI